MNILVTAFKPFNGKDENMSSLVLNQLQGVDKLLLDVLFEKSFLSLKTHLNNHPYDYIICLGEALYDHVHLEHIALNVMHANIPDNALEKPQNQFIDKHGPLAITSTLPLSEIKQNLSSSHVKDSYHAGTYVCNDLFYRLMSLPIQTPRGFIHVPSKTNHLELTTETIQEIINILNKRGFN